MSSIASKCTESTYNQKFINIFDCNMQDNAVSIYQYLASEEEKEKIIFIRYKIPLAFGDASLIGVKCLIDTTDE